eukprot:1507938-Rhodomonas_salina.2
MPIIVIERNAIVSTVYASYTPTCVHTTTITSVPETTNSSILLQKTCTVSACLYGGGGGACVHTNLPCVVAKPSWKTADSTKKDVIMHVRLRDSPVCSMWPYIVMLPKPWSFVMLGDTNVALSRGIHVVTVCVNGIWGSPFTMPMARILRADTACSATANRLQLFSQADPYGRNRDSALLVVGMRVRMPPSPLARFIQWPSLMHSTFQCI